MADLSLPRRKAQEGHFVYCPWWQIRFHRGAPRRRRCRMVGLMPMLQDLATGEAAARPNGVRNWRRLRVSAGRSADSTARTITPTGGRNSRPGSSNRYAATTALRCGQHARGHSGAKGRPRFLLHEPRPELAIRRNSHCTTSRCAGKLVWSVCRTVGQANPVATAPCGCERQPQCPPRLPDVGLRAGQTAGQQC